MLRNQLFRITIVVKIDVLDRHDNKISYQMFSNSKIDRQWHRPYLISRVEELIEIKIMLLLSNVVKDAIPNYLAGLPIPDSFRGWFQLSFRDWLALVPPTLAISGLSYVSYKTVKKAREGSRLVNQSVQKDKKVVVDFIDIEDIANRPLCRCWKSKKFPYCDGFHNAHNIVTGDNTGPAVVRHKNK